MSSVELLGHLPAPKHTTAAAYDVSSDAWFKDRLEVAKAPAVTGGRSREPPPYGKRAGFVPRRVEDFGDGGAFPEIHVAQYPLNMGRKEERPDSKILPVSVDAQGKIAFDAIVKQSENASKTVFSQHHELVPKLPNEVDTGRPGDDEIDATTERTKAALEKIVSARLSAAQPKSLPSQSTAPSYIKYTPSQQSAAFNSGAKERVIRMVEMPRDPLEPPKFKHKRVPKASGSPPVPVMHSPPRPVTVKDQQDWKIPPCISNWKNPKGYTIPLDKRLAADGRGLQEVQINDSFAKLSEALYVAEQKAREAVEMRSKIQRELILKEKEKKEQELRMLAQRARMERAGGPSGTVDRTAAAGDRLGSGSGVAERSLGDLNGARDSGRPPIPRDDRVRETKDEREDRQKRELIREDRRRERERERRLEAKDGPAGKKSKLTRDRDRDVSERVALGMAHTGGRGEEVMYDQRLFNQQQGMESGFGADDSYNVYDKGLFTSHSALGGLYRPKKDSEHEIYGGSNDEQQKTDRFRADRGFAGASDRAGPRDRPVEFERDAEEADPFGLDQFLTEVKKGKKLDKIGGGGTMRASGGGGTRDSYEGGSGRTRVDFQRGHGR